VPEQGRWAGGNALCHQAVEIGLDALEKQCFGNAGLHHAHIHYNPTSTGHWVWHFVQTHIAVTVNSPGTHGG
jgi:hypothetical protein